MRERIQTTLGAPRLAIVGCGAVAHLYAAPALEELVSAGEAELVAAVDPQTERAAALAERFPGARVSTDIGALDSVAADAVMLCSPARLHAEQARTLLGRGLHVWCEKPMADSSAGCSSMLEAASSSGRLLVVGHVRRHAGALVLAHRWIRSGHLGSVRRVEVEEGGPFDWPAATPSFFERSLTGGGVFLDVGVHVLDVLFWWLGEPVRCTYADDACDNVEANALAEFAWADGATARVRLSRDWRTAGTTRVVAERGELLWRIGEPDALRITLPGFPTQLVRAQEGPAACAWSGAYRSQVRAFVARLRGDFQAPLVTGVEGRLAVDWIERCYRGRNVLEQPWLDAAEADAFVRRTRSALLP